MPLTAGLQPPPILHWGFAAAFAIALALALIALRAPIALSRGPSAAWTPTRTPLWRSLLTLLALGAGAFAAYLFIFGVNTWPPISSERRVGWGIAGLTIVSSLLALFSLPARLDSADPAAPRSRFPAFAWLALISVVLGALGAVAAIWTQFTRSPDRPAAVIAALIGAGATALIALPLGALDRRGSSFSAAFILAGVALATGASILGSGSITLGQTTLGLAFPALALAIISAIKRGASVGSLTIALAAGVLTMLMLAARTFSFLPVHSALILAASPLAGFLTHTLLPRSLSPKPRAACTIIASALVAAAGVGTAVSIEGQSDSGSGSEYTY